MTLAEIKAALLDGATVRIVGFDYVDNYHVSTYCDGLSLGFYLNDEAYEIKSVFSDIERALSRRNVRVFRKEFTDGILITIIIGIGDEC